jgi:hypothetical protein
MHENWILYATRTLGSEDRSIRAQQFSFDSTPLRESHDREGQDVQ